MMSDAFICIIKYIIVIIIISVVKTVIITTNIVSSSDAIILTVAMRRVTQVKLTKDHHLVTTAELESGKFDAMIKESFEPLMCSKHGEALRLYCTEPSCAAPICTVCKTTQGHDGHTAIELNEQVITRDHDLTGNSRTP